MFRSNREHETIFRIKKELKSKIDVKYDVTVVEQTRNVTDGLECNDAFIDDVTLIGSRLLYF